MASWRAMHRNVGALLFRADCSRPPRSLSQEALLLAELA